MHIQTSFRFALSLVAFTLAACSIEEDSSLGKDQNNVNGAGTSGAAGSGVAGTSGEGGASGKNTGGSDPAGNGGSGGSTTAGCSSNADCPAGQFCQNSLCVADGPKAEVCNGLDDDQDGQIDEGAPCPAGQSCIEGACSASNPACTSDADCPAGEYCKAGVCEASPPALCSSDADCPSGQFCQGGLCQGTAPAECKSNADCTGENQVCMAGQCVVEPPFGCASNADCAQGQVCEENFCVPAGAACASDADCPAGEYCKEGACKASPPALCGSDADCPAGQFCQGGLCQGTPPAGCSSNADCPAGQVCQNSLCAADGPKAEACNGLDDDQDGQIDEGASCPAGQSCIEGACSASNPACSSDVDCPVGQVCKASVCTLPLVSRRAGLARGEAGGIVLQGSACMTDAAQPELLRMPPGRALWRLAWPVIALGLIRSGYHLAAAYWAGRLPDAGAAQAALGATSFAVWILMSVGDLAAVGVHALVARAEGARERWRVGEMVVQAAWIAGALGALIALTAPRLSALYFDAMSFRGVAFEAARRMGDGYLSALLVGSVPVFWHLMLSAVFRGMGDTRTPLVISMLTLALNAALDPALMFGWFGLPTMGLAGAGWATIAAHGVGLALFVVALRGAGVRLVLRWPEAARVARVVQIGGPSMASGIGFCMVYVALGDLLASFGPSALAGLGLGHRLEGPAYQVCAGFGAAAATLVGQHLGAGDPEGARQAAHRTARWACLAMTPLSLLFLSAPRWLVGLFSPDAEAVARGASYLFYLGLILAPMALEVVYESAFAGAGETWIAMAIVIVFTAARLPLAWWLTGPFGLVGVWITIMITCAAKGFLLWGAFFARSRRKGWGSGAHLA